MRKDDRRGGSQLHGAPSFHSYSDQYHICANVDRAEEFQDLFQVRRFGPFEPQPALRRGDQTGMTILQSSCFPGCADWWLALRENSECLCLAKSRETTAIDLSRLQ